MGSFNMNCAVSNLPIFDRQDVYIIFLVRNSFDVSATSTNGHFQPISLPMKASYGDYGRFEIENKNDFEMFKKSALENNIIEMEEGSNKYHEQEVSISKIDVYSIFSMIHDQRLLLKPDSILHIFNKPTSDNCVDYDLVANNFNPVSYMAIHADLFERIMDSYGDMETYFNDRIKKNLLSNISAISLFTYINVIAPNKIEYALFRDFTDDMLLTGFDETMEKYEISDDIIQKIYAIRMLENNKLNYYTDNVLLGSLVSDIRGAYSIDRFDDFLYRTNKIFTPSRYAGQDFFEKETQLINNYVDEFIKREQDEQEY